MSKVSVPVYVRILQSTCGSKIDEKTPTGCQVSFWIIRTIPFILVIIGTIGNVLNLIVLSRANVRKHSTTIFLLVLAASDLITLWDGIVRNTLIHGWTVDIRDMSVVACAIQELVLFTGGLYSVSLLAVISVDRMVRTKFPAAARFLITKRNTKIICAGLLIICVLICIHLPFGKTYQRVEQMSYSNETKVVSMCTYVSPTYIKFYTSEWPLILIFGFNVIPPLVLVCCNGVIIWALYMQRQRIQPSANGSNTTTSRSIALTRIAIIISIYFLVTASPYHSFVYYLGGLPDDTADEYIPNLFLVYMIVYYFGMSNFALNFFFYFSSGPMFKRELRSFWKEASTCVRGMLGLPIETVEAETVTRTETLATGN